jgi:hypothetical protein
MDFNSNPQRPIAIQDESRMSQENRMPHPPQITRESDVRNSPDHGQAHGQPHDQNMGGMGPGHEGMKPMKYKMSLIFSNHPSGGAVIPQVVV